MPGSTARSAKGDDPGKTEESQKKDKKEKEFAWMDSDDDDDAVNENAASSEESEHVPAEKAPVARAYFALFLFIPVPKPG